MHIYCPGSYQKSVGTDRHSTFSQLSMSRYLYIVKEAIVNNLTNKISSNNGRNYRVCIVSSCIINFLTNILDFFENFNFPRIGAE